MTLYARLQHIIKNILLYLYLLVYLGVLSLLLLVPEQINYLCKNHFMFNNTSLLIFGILFLVSLFLSCKNKELFFSNFKSKKYLYLFSFTVFVMQLIVCYNIQFLTGWDVSVLLWNAKLIAEESYNNLSNEYFSIYPNNIFVVFLFSQIFKFLQLIGIDSFIRGVRLIVVLQSLLSIGTLFLLTRVIWDITKSYVYSLLSVIIYLLLVGFSPWLVITYSDSMGLIFPILILSIYSRINEGNIFINTFVIGIITFVGFKIKPQVTFITIAIVIVELLYLNIKSISRKNCNKKLKIMSCFISAFIICSFIYSSFIIPATHFKLNKEAAYGATHFLMMGHDYTRGGVWSGRDVKFSGSIPTKKERAKENVRVFKERIKHLGQEGLVKFYLKKTLTNFNDGTFAWGMEGKFYKTIFKDKNNHLSPFLRNVFYHNGNYFVYWKTVMQTIWLVVLFFNCCLIFGKDLILKNKVLFVAIVSIIGLTIFETLFEARARYLYTYVPVYIMLAVIGLRSSYERFSEFLKMQLSKEETKI